MPTLAQSLEGQDFGHFQIVAETWGIELDAQDSRQANKTLSARIPELLFSQWVELAPDVQNALTEMSHEGGRLRWAQFVRKFGELRDIGAGRRDKDLPHRNPISITEKLWYRALIGRAFLDSQDGPQEFAFIPDDLLAKLPSKTNAETEILGRLARPEERALEIPATDRILDEACTVLAGLRGGLTESELKAADDWHIPIETMKALLSAAKIIDKEGKPIPEETRRHLESSRGDALGLLTRTWLQSQELNDLRLMPGLAAEGNWENEPVSAREKIIGYLRAVPAGQWWSIASLVADIKTKNPDYLRTDHESWYLRDSNSGEYLRGFEHWGAIDGALIAYLIRGPLHWLGILDLAAPTEGQPAAAFRWSRWADILLNQQSTLILKAESSRLKVDSRGTVFVPPFVPRALRYVLSRFCDWQPKQKDAYRYQISAGALERARKQGLEVRQLAGLLKAHNSSALPPNLVQALKRWEQQGTQARIESMQVLRLNSAAALKALRTSKAARYLGEPLGPTSVVIKAGAGQQVLQVLVELGYLGTLDQEIK